LERSAGYRHDARLHVRPQEASAFLTLDDALLVRVFQKVASVRARARLAATCTRFAGAVAASWNALTVCSPRDAPLAWTLALLSRELAFLEELTLHVSPESPGPGRPSLLLRSPRSLQKVDLRTSLLTPGLLASLGAATGLRQLELELPDALCAAGRVTLSELAPLAGLQRLAVSTKWSVRQSNSTVIELAASLTALTALTYLAVCGANVFSVATPAAADALLSHVAMLWVGTLRCRCGSHAAYTCRAGRVCSSSLHVHMHAPAAFL